MKKRILTLFVVLLLAFSVTSCGKGKKKGDDSADNPPVVDPSIEPTDPGKNPDNPGTDPVDPGTDPVDPQETDESKLIAYKNAAFAKLDEVVNPAITKVPEGELKTAIQTYYNNEKQYIESIIDLNTAKDAATKVVNDTKEFVKNTMKPLLIEALNEVFNFSINEISYEPLKTSLQKFYNAEIAKLSNVETLTELILLGEEIEADTIEFFETESLKFINELKNKALEKLDELILAAIQKITNDDLKLSIQGFYNKEKQYIQEIHNLEDAEEALDLIVEDTENFVIDQLKPLVIDKIGAVVEPLIDKISNVDLKATVQDFYDTEMEKVASIETVDDAVDVYEEIVDDTKQFIIDETEKIVIALKNKAIEELDPYVTALIAKIPYEKLKTDTQTFYNTEKAKLAAVDTIEGVEPCVLEIKEDLEEYALTETKKLAISELEELIDSGLAIIPNEELKDDLEEFAATEIAKLNAVSKLEDVPTTLATVLTETAEFIKELVASTLREYIKLLTTKETTTAFDYLPEAMCPNYATNVVTPSSINYDFTSFTSVSSISKAGYGEQWQMVIDNINQSAMVANVLNYVQTALTSAGNAIDIYVLNSYAEEISYSFTGENYSCNFDYDGSLVIIDLELSTNISIPVIGSVKPVIRLQYDITEQAKAVFISLGDVYKVKYVIREDAYEIASTYGVTVAGETGTRAALLSISKDNNQTEGYIYEYTTIVGKDLISACADFYVDDTYVSVVGNKASGMLVTNNTINELYSLSSGRLLGYEVQEDVVEGALGYSTLWFNLWDIAGITNIKVCDKTKDNESKKSNYDVYLNNSTSLLVPTYNKKLGVKTSRKYDVELRTKYYYTYDEENEKYVSNEVEVPMFFIQEGDNFNTFASDILADNGLELTVGLSQTILNKIISDHKILIEIFNTNKEQVTSEQIIAYLSLYE